MHAPNVPITLRVFDYIYSWSLGYYITGYLLDTNGILTILESIRHFLCAYYSRVGHDK